ncbi:MAG: class I tRNA ligase family protein, partial [Oscillospiraceae bacterium]|nr:class I tRNA ligase family protein [Oscillospiraceae bacterium]
MFIGSFEPAASCSDNAVKGRKRFLDRVWNLSESCGGSLDYTPANESSIHKAIKKVADDIEAMKFNTAIAAMMALVNDFYANGCSKGDMKTLLLLLNPFAPHMCEELWETMGFAAAEGKMACQMSWPVYDESKTIASSVEMAVQVQGKLRGTINVPVDSEETAVVEAARAVDKVARAIEGMEIVKVIHVKNKLVNLIVKPAK